MPSERSLRNLKPWKKGQSGNLAGRSPNPSTLLSQALKKVLVEVDPEKHQTYAEIIARKLVTEVAKKSTKLSGSLVMAFAETADRTERKPTQKAQIGLTHHEERELRNQELADLFAEAVRGSGLTQSLQT